MLGTSGQGCDGSMVSWAFAHHLPHSRLWTGGRGGDKGWVVKVLSSSSGVSSRLKVN